MEAGQRDELELVAHGTQFALELDDGDLNPLFSISNDIYKYHLSFIKVTFYSAAALLLHL